MKKLGKSVWMRLGFAPLVQLAVMGSAHANLFDIGNTVIDLAKLFTQVVIVCAVLVGVAAVVYGITLMRKKAGERGEDISVARIIIAVTSGCAAIVLGFVIAATTETFGAGAGDIGKNLF
ncbi:DUF6750 family protein [Achromobacter sp. DH1f]|uniref:DUF6750 family protein n=1 Tax=Achromobacter sp. DH1f TaxID=1397275 RepID=UPI000467F43A|nr:DUF6750 family protein [Achromobacter sp. DH1f]